MVTDAHMDTLASRLRHAREAADLTQSAVAKRFSINRVSVSNWETGSSRPDVDKLPEIAEMYGTTVEWLMAGSGPAPEAGKPRTPGRATAPPTIIPGEELVGARDFPVYAAAMGGHGHEIVTFDPIDWVKRPVILERVKGAYGILVVNTSMSPMYRPNDIALINPHLAPTPDTEVVLYHTPPHGEAEAMIKTLVGSTAKEWKLRQYNPAQDFTEDRVDWPICHRVVGKYDRR